ncbi:MAG: hypothetical protein IKP10_05415 [Clostridia bacterium]|nr:hypothetical protein [Clostridia bacterium]
MSGPDTRVLRFLAGHAVTIGHACGFDRLREDPHGTWLREMLLGAGDYTLLAHRGSYKTTCLSLALAVTLCTRPMHSLLFLRKTDRDVEEVLRQVRRILLSDMMQAVTARLYGGEPVRVLRATAHDIDCDCRVTVRGVTQLHGQGVGGSLTGRHADWIFTDDIVNLRDRLSAAERDRTRQVWQELQNIRNPGGRIISAGTPWHPEDAVSLMPRPRKYDCHATGLMTPAQIEEMRQSMDPALFAANYELRHIPSAGTLFRTVPSFAPSGECLRDGIAHLDASYGGGDCTALTLGAAGPEGPVLYGRLWHGHVDGALEEIRALCRYYRCEPLWLEVNGDRGYLARLLRDMGMTVHPYTERMNKHVKIATWLRAAWPTVRLVRGTDPEWLDQILGYTEGAAHDDAPDSAASLLRALGRRGVFSQFDGV